MPHRDVTSDPSRALHPTVNEQNTTYRYLQYFASTDCLPLQTLMQAAQHANTMALNTLL